MTDRRLWQGTGPRPAPRSGSTTRRVGANTPIGRDGRGANDVRSRQIGSHIHTAQRGSPLQQQQCAAAAKLGSDATSSVPRRLAYVDRRTGPGGLPCARPGHRRPNCCHSVMRSGMNDDSTMLVIEAGFEAARSRLYAPRLH